jgi:cyclophilin family peptidyl-prolyl cis-trans isomerase
MSVTKVLVILLAAVAIGGAVYVLRPEPVVDLSPNMSPSPSPSERGELKPLPELVEIVLRTSQGEVELVLDGTVAPVTVGNFVDLAEQGFYNGTTFHRVIPDFMIQGGDPLSKDSSLRPRHGTGGPGYTFQDEINAQSIVRGTMAMANAGPNTNGSQFFIVTAEATPFLDGKHTYFGKVVRGMEVVEAISQVERDAQDNPLEPVVIEEVVVKRATQPLL